MFQKKRMLIPMKGVLGFLLMFGLLNPTLAAIWYLATSWGSPSLPLPLLFAMAIGGCAGVISHFFSGWMQEKLGVEKIPYKWDCLRT